MPTFVGNPPNPDDIPPDNPPGPPTDPPPLGGGTTYYMSTTGDDADPGDVTNPWLTLGKFLGLALPGDNLLCRGGTYTGSGIRRIDWADFGASGTVDDYITVAAYTAETPIFNGQANGTSDDDIYWLSVNGSFSYIVFDGIKLTNYAMIQNGLVTISNQAEGQTVHDWTFRNMDIQQVAPADPSAQFIYVGERFYNLLSEDNIYRGPYPGGSVTGGAAISAYADDGPGPYGIVSRGDQYIGCYTGYQLYHVDATGECSDGVFTGCQTNIDLTRHSNVTIIDNTGDHGDGADIYDPTYSGMTVAYGNVFT